MRTDKTIFFAGGEPIPRLVRQTDGEASKTCREPGIDRPKPVVKEAQSVVLPALLIQMGDVTTEGLCDPRLRGLQDGKPSQQLHQEVDGLALLLL